MGKSGAAKCPDSLLISHELKIGLINPSKPHIPVSQLTDNFFSACSPVVSFDGKTMIFTGRKTENDPWQIWEMNLRNSKVRQITTCKENCLFPAYLPGGQIVFSRVMSNDSLKSGMALFKYSPDKNICERITFNPAVWYASSVLSDGRILAKCMDNLPGRGEPELMVLRPDGTKAELFYKRNGSLTGGKAIETSDGNIFFTETTRTKESDLISIFYNSPFNSAKVLSEDIHGDFISVSEGADGKMMVCYRTSPGETYRLFEFDVETGLGNLLHEKKDYDVLDAVLIRELKNPRKLPSEVDNGVKTGLLMCQNISYPVTDLRNYKKPERVEILGIDVSYGTIEPEPDGSVYLKVMADKPFRLATVDSGGRVIKMCKWMSLRPNERRGCTGCHEDPEVVPENRIPLAVRKDPVILPVHIQKIDEKIIELE